MTQRKQGFGACYLAVFFFSFLAYQISPTTIRADDESAGTFGASYLKIPVGAALMSVPDIVAGMDPDGSLAFSNPAAVARMQRGQVFFSRAAWLDELSLNAASIVVPLPEYDIGFSFATRLLHAGGLQGYSSAGEVVTEESYYGMGFSGALSKQFRSLGLSVGVGMTYLRERLPVETGDGVAMSFGASYRRGSHHLDAFAQDVGGQISFEGREYPVDGRYVFGYGYAFNQNWGRLDIGSQLVVSRSDLKRLQFGAVYHLPRFFVLRGGLDRTFDSASTAQLPLSAGFGLRYGNMMLDYAYTPQEYFDNTHTFSIGVSFGGGSDPAPPSVPVYGATDQPLPIPGHERTSVSQGTPTPKAANVTTRDDATSNRMYAIVAGSHGRVESARAEARALSLVKVPATVEAHGGDFVVVIGRYTSQEEAKEALVSYERRGHHFEIRPEMH